MNTLCKYILAGALACAATAAATAQNTLSGYFLDNYTYRYQMNPAFADSLTKNFVSMPALGNVNAAVRGNLAVSSVVYPLNGRTVLFTNPGISTAEVMKNIHERNRIGANVKLTVLSAGFKAFGGYNTVTLNGVANVNAQIPGSLFSLAKEGVTNKTYDITNLRASAMGYAELALGHSHYIKKVPGLRVGAAIKFLVGIANVDAYFNEAHLTLGENDWTATTNADIYANIGGWQYEHKYNKRSGKEYVSGVNFDDDDSSVGPNGFGMAFDLGAEYKWRDFSFSLAVLDLGFINYTGTKYATTDGYQTFNTDAYIFNADGDADNSFKKEWKRFRGNLDELYQLTDKGDIGSRARALNATLNVGVDYAFPLYRKLHFGLLSSTRIAGKYTWTEARLSANVHPVKCFSADVNVAAGTYGASFGWLLNFHHTGFNMFLGMDHTLGELSKEGVPLSSNASLNLGINFPF